MWQRWNQTTHIFEKSDNDGATWVPLPLSGAIITEGTVPRGRYDAQTAFRDINNNFVGQTLADYTRIFGANHQFFLESTASPAEQRVWRFLTYGNGNITCEAMNDASSVVQINPMTIGRNGILYGHILSTNTYLRFPAAQIASAGVNDLDDYEEGYWSPTLLGSSGGAGTSYGEQSGSYTKIGNLVIATFSVIIYAANAWSGYLLLGGVPFVGFGGAYQMGTLDYWNIYSPASYGIKTHFPPSAGYQYFITTTAPSTLGHGYILVVTDVQPNSHFRGQIVYRTNT